MIEFVGIILVAYILWLLFFRQKKEKLIEKEEKSIDFTKDSAYYMREFPEILGESKPLKAEPTKEEKPNITINITNNHLHIYPPGEDQK
ncbi:hypothetical protein LZ575_02985 [Antarcticibacterium sp. 1MA-6-2]|uniref:hypothetical protein n=1 Tax=Antarcticibacterium sp. 1MA-6-2 TaxID=2908210 RepID=UPI001F169F21|nr:hypothetical protein [Antarcticibacterium sp. 1MA-6-2]UJH91667.1 hypothetical protein LZ575_02985 [Antarcticibacterium sp. 1MA-6-2]